MAEEIVWIGHSSRAGWCAGILFLFQQPCGYSSLLFQRFLMKILLPQRLQLIGLLVGLLVGLLIGQWPAWGGTDANAEPARSGAARDWSQVAPACPKGSTVAITLNLPFLPMSPPA